MDEYQDVFYESEDKLQLYARDYAHPKPRATVLCMHGLTRNSADFTSICEALHPEYRIISVDQRGRGRSAYDPDPANYAPQVYVRDMFTLLEHLRLDRVIALGTSMGGVISMAMAATNAARFEGVILNDLGPEIDAAGLNRIRGYVGQQRPVRNWEDAAAQVRETNGIAFPDYTEENWLAFARNVYTPNAAGEPVLAHDPAISASLKQNNVAVDMWPLFEAMNALPLLVIRGATSDILAPACVAEMQRRRPDLVSIEVPNRGHAPMLDEPQAQRAIRSFLEGLSR